MAQTINYLTENHLLVYEDLEKKAKVITDNFNQLSTEIKAAEKRMAEIAILKTHIINYAKTRDVYTDYRKAGYSKKFYEDYAVDLLLHKAAKTAFNELGMKNLPTVKTLQSEYAELITQKKKSYELYRSTKKEMQEVLTARANIDRLLQSETPEKEKKNPLEQR